MANKPVVLSYQDTLDYMFLIQTAMTSNKIRFNELKNAADFEGRQWSMDFCKQENERFRDTWFRLNKEAGLANNCIEIFNATKQREINDKLCK